MSMRDLAFKRRISFHPLCCAELGVVREVLGRDRRFRLSHLGPWVASLAVARQRKPWIEKTRAAAAAVPGDWHRTLPPIFVLGFWRSGTTLLHELLARDFSLASPTLVDILFPSDAPYLLRHKRDAVGAIAKLRLDADGSPSKPTRMVDLVEITLQSPQEEELAMCHLAAPSFFRVSYFPREQDAHVDEALFAGEGSSERAQWRSAHELFLRTLTVKYSGRRLLLKNPANCCRIPDLLALYPDALFVRIDRTPEGSIPSFVRMMDHSYREFSLQGSATPPSTEAASAFHQRFMEKFDADWALVDPARSVAVRYEELTEAPLKTLSRIYDRLGLERSEETEVRQRRFWRRKGRRWSPSAPPPPADEAEEDDLAAVSP